MIPSEPVDIAMVLTKRLVTIGIESDFIPGLLKDIYNAFYHEPDISRDKINKKLRSLGWTDIDLDYHTFSLAEANLRGYAKIIYPERRKRQLEQISVQ